MENENTILATINSLRQFNLHPLLEHSPDLSLAAERRAKDLSTSLPPTESEEIMVKPMPGGSLFQIQITLPRESQLAALLPQWNLQGRFAGHILNDQHVKSFGVGFAESRWYRTWIILLLGDNHPVVPTANKISTIEAANDDDSASFVFDEGSISEGDEMPLDEGITIPASSSPPIATNDEGYSSGWVDIADDDYDDHGEETLDEDDAVLEDELDEEDDDDPGSYSKLLEIAKKGIPGE